MNILYPHGFYEHYILYFILLSPIIQLTVHYKLLRIA